MSPSPPRERVWNGCVKPGQTAAHEAFVTWLASDEGQRLLARTLLSSYRLAQDGERLTITLSAADPPSLVRFLRDPRFWSAAWEFLSADPGQALGAGAPVRVAWRRPPGER